MADKVIVIGGGAAGLMAAGSAAERGADAVLLEKNDILGKKLRISGKGRCNITNAMPINDFTACYPGNGRFLYSALTRFTNQDLTAFFGRYGVKTKVERGGRVFPESDSAHQVADALIRYAKDHGVEFRMNTRVTEISAINGQIDGVETDVGFLSANRVILATGGASYPGTGSTGDGYRLAAALGHTIITPFPALVPLRTRETWVKQVSGLSLRNVSATIIKGNDTKRAATEFGEMLFAHFGVTGPIILTLSRQAGLWLREGFPVTLRIDLKPALSESQLDQRIQRDFGQVQRKQFKNSLGRLLPKNLIPVIVALSGIDPEKPVHQITRSERLNLVTLLKRLELSIIETLPLQAAIVTAGGVCVKEIDPKTMQSRLVKGLFFAGEVIDVDGVTGGFNLQAAFSTGRLAGISAVEGN
ncbi:MAG: NAD(P)/FAD-dependent oxidoreductase [Limnochordia bacterium]|nr:NAD(P)/FAD-dependent oxidoreductase [Bacillota bacterium]HXK96271.1 NAD(P)/FAD-dependent oxidoreductase [Limnochordia bacterium]